MSTENIKVFTDVNFEEEVLKSDRPVLVDFWAEWCAPCRMMAAAVDAVAQPFPDPARVEPNDGQPVPHALESNGAERLRPN